LRRALAGPIGNAYLRFLGISGIDVQYQSWPRLRTNRRRTRREPAPENVARCRCRPPAHAQVRALRRGLVAGSNRLAVAVRF
jgi:hypothetical protein